MNIKVRLGWLLFLLLTFHVPVSVAEPVLSSTNTVRIAAAQADDWEETSSGALQEREGLPPIAAS